MTRVLPHPPKSGTEKCWCYSTSPFIAARKRNPIDNSIHLHATMRYSQLNERVEAIVKGSVGECVQLVAVEGAFGFAGDEKGRGGAEE